MSERSWRPDWVVAPGKLLVDALAERGMTQAELARRTDRPLKTINEIAKGKTAIHPDTALQLEKVLGIPASYWLNLERAFAEGRARQKERAEFESEAEWVRNFPLAALRKAGVLSSAAPTAEVFGQLLRFFEVSNPAGWSRYWERTQASFRKSAAFTESTEALCSWLRLGELKATKIVCAPYDRGALERLMVDLRPMTQLEAFAFRARLEAALAAVGVALVLVRELPGCHVSGAARWLRTDLPLVQLSLRHKTDDQFWFTLFHELAHLLLRDARTDFLDLVETEVGNDDEGRANAQARRWLIDEADYTAFLAQQDFRASRIQEFADHAGIAAGIVVGFLERDGKVKPGPLRHLKRGIKWPEEAQAA